MIRGCTETCRVRERTALLWDECKRHISKSISFCGAGREALAPDHNSELAVRLRRCGDPLGSWGAGTLGSSDADDIKPCGAVWCVLT